MPKREEIKKFGEKIFLACKSYLEARKRYGQKYQNAELPQTWDDDILGYHSSCYKDFKVKKQFLQQEG